MSHRSKNSRKRRTNERTKKKEKKQNSEKERKEKNLRSKKIELNWGWKRHLNKVARSAEAEARAKKIRTRRQWERQKVACLQPLTVLTSMFHHCGVVLGGGRKIYRHCFHTPLSNSTFSRPDFDKGKYKVWYRATGKSVKWLTYIFNVRHPTFLLLPETIRLRSIVKTRASLCCAVTLNQVPEQ